MPSRRPSAEELVSRLEEMRTDTDGPCGELTRLDALRYVATAKVLGKRDADAREKANELAAKDNEIRQLQEQLQVYMIWCSMCVYQSRSLA